MGCFLWFGFFVVTKPNYDVLEGECSATFVLRKTLVLKFLLKLKVEFLVGYMEVTCAHPSKLKGAKGCSDYQRLAKLVVKRTWLDLGRVQGRKSLRSSYFEMRGSYLKCNNF